MKNSIMFPQVTSYNAFISVSFSDVNIYRVLGQKREERGQQIQVILASLRKRGSFVYGPSLMCGL